MSTDRKHSFILSLVILVIKMFLSQAIFGKPELKLTVTDKINSNIYLKCTSDTEPFGDTAEFLVDGITYDNVRKYENGCYSTKDAVKCTSATCDCSQDGRSFMLAYEIQIELGVITFGCSMRFVSLNNSNLIHIRTEVLKEVVDSRLVNTVSTERSKKGENGSDDNATALNCHNLNLHRSSSFYNICGEPNNTSEKVTIVKDILGLECVCFYNESTGETNKSSNKVFILVICLGMTIILPVIVLALTQVFHHCEKGSQNTRTEETRSNGLLYEDMTRERTDMHVYWTTHENNITIDQQPHVYDTPVITQDSGLI